MDKNSHLHNLLGGRSEHIGDWTPQQLADFITGLGNDPTAMPHAFKARSIDLTENFTVRGKPFEHAVIPRGVTMGDAKGKATGVYPKNSGTMTLNGAYHALDRASKRVFAESFDASHAGGIASSALISGTARMTAIHVPTRERLTHMNINYTVFEAGGTFTYGGYALYGPLTWTPGTGVNLASVPQVVITETNMVSNFRVGGTHFVANGMHAYTGPWDIVLEPGIYFVVGLYVFSVAPGTNAALASLADAAAGIAVSSLNIPSFTDVGSLAGQTALPANLDTTAYTPGGARMWVALYDDSTKQI